MRLSNDNAILKEETDVLRGEILQAKKLAASLQTQLDNSKAGGLERSSQSKDSIKSYSSRSAIADGSIGAESEGSVETHEARLSNLMKKAKALEQVNGRKCVTQRHVKGMLAVQGLSCMSFYILCRRIQN